MSLEPGAPTTIAVPTFSIITICKNDEPGLLKTLKSVRSQFFTNYEHILVLAGECGNIANYSSAKVVIDPGHGISAAFNVGVQKSVGDYVIFLNAGDCLIDCDALDILSKECQSNFRIISGFSSKEKWGGTIPRSKPNLARFEGRSYLSHQATAFRRDLFSEIGLFDTKLFIRMDLDWLCRISSTEPIKFIEATITVFESGGVSEVRVVKSTVEEIKIISRYLPKSANRLLFLVTLLFWYRLVRLCARKLLNYAN